MEKRANRRNMKREINEVEWMSLNVCQQKKNTGGDNRLADWFVVHFLADVTLRTFDV